MPKYEHTVLQMGTLVHFRVLSDADEHEVLQAISAARALFQQVEAACSRFDENSELRRLCQRVGEAVPVSPILFEAVRFAVAMAEETDGLFDPDAWSPAPRCRVPHPLPDGNPRERRNGFARRNILPGPDPG